MYARARFELRPVLTGARGKSVREVHLLKDEPRVAILQKKVEQERRDALRVAHVATPSVGADCHSGLPMDNPSGEWSWTADVMGNRREKDLLAGAYLMIFAIVAIELNPELQVLGACTQQVVVYMHCTALWATMLILS